MVAKIVSKDPVFAVPKRLSKRVYGEASFTEASTVTGSLPVAVKRRPLYLLKLALFASLHEACTKLQA